MTSGVQHGHTAVGQCLAYIHVIATSQFIILEEKLSYLFPLRIDRKNREGILPFTVILFIENILSHMTADEKRLEMRLHSFK